MESILKEHLGYISDPVRLERFTEALRSVIRRGDRVADLGAGSGVLGLLALQAGAGHVFSIDESGAIELARESVGRSAVSDRVSFICGRSEQVELPERVDVAVCDHVGWFGFDYGIIELLADARRRFLNPGGRLVPQRIRLEIGAVESDACRKLTEGWRSEIVPEDFRRLRRYSVNCKHPVELAREHLISGAARLGDIDLREEQPGFFSWNASLVVNRGGLVDGLGGWFASELAPGVWMTNSPLADKPIRRSQVFFPIEEPVRVMEGDRIEATIMARPADGLISWNLAFPASGLGFAHSTWQGLLLLPEDLARANPHRVPLANKVGLARSVVLGYCDGTRTVADVEEAVLRDHPALFPSAAEIRHFVAKVLAKDTH